MMTDWNDLFRRKNRGLKGFVRGLSDDDLLDALEDVEQEKWRDLCLDELKERGLPSPLDFDQDSRSRWQSL